jgi:hypothetical protein
VRKSRNEAAVDYKDRITDLQKRLEAAVEEHRRMRRELEALDLRDPYHLLTTRRPLPHVDDDARN